LACGIHDTDAVFPQEAFCTDAKKVRTEGCPTGFVRRGNYDAGRPSGHGLAWCEKFTP
jgi:hypothetical protein